MRGEGIRWEAKGLLPLISKVTKATASTLQNEAIAFTMFFLCIDLMESGNTNMGVKTHRQKTLPLTKAWETVSVFCKSHAAS